MPPSASWKFETMDEFGSVITCGEDKKKAGDKNQKINPTSHWTPKVTGKNHREDERACSEKSKTQMTRKKIFKLFRVFQAQHSKKSYN